MFHKHRQFVFGSTKTCAMSLRHCQFVFVLMKNICNVSQTFSICFSVEENHVQCLANISNSFLCQRKACTMFHQHRQFVFLSTKNMCNVSQALSICFCVDEKHLQCLTNIVNLILCQRKACTMFDEHRQFVFVSTKNMCDAPQTLPICFCIGEIHIQCLTNILNFFLC